MYVASVETRFPLMAAAFAACFSLSCTLSEAEPPPDDDGVYLPDQKAETSVVGFLFDKEAFFFSAATCPSCGGFVARGDGPNLQRSLIQDGAIKVHDTQSLSAVATSRAPTDEKGTWRSTPFTASQQARVLVSSGGVGKRVAGPTVNAPAIPLGGYLPTASMRALIAHHGFCLSMDSVQLSDIGVLESVAKMLTAEGTPTTPQDLVSGDRFAAVVVLALYQQDADPLQRRPAKDLSVEVQGGRVLQINFAPPSANLPAEAKAVQSKLGFFVDASANASTQAGLAVVVVPRTSSEGKVKLRVKDPVQNQLTHRPWAHPDMEFSLPKGTVGFVPVRMQPQDTGPVDPEDETEPLPLFLCDRL
jgi:hypothetical protein